jgi:FAD:protein FMN transferase
LSTLIRDNANPLSPATSLRFSHFAMATEFEIYIAEASPLYAAQACHEVFAELDRLENELSRFLAGSDVTRINHMQPGERIVVGPDAMACLKSCFQLYLETEGAFDITVGALYQCWLNDDKTNKGPSPQEIMDAGVRTGLHHLFFDEETFTVSIDLAGLQIDLGAFAKGYSVDKMIGILRDWEIPAALIHGGNSSVYAYSGGEGWLAVISHPLDHAQILRRWTLQNSAMGGSGIQKGRHIIDPRSGHPIEDRLAAWVIAPEAATADALSTAFMVMSIEEVKQFCRCHGEIKAVVLPGKEAELLTFGL